MPPRCYFVVKGVGVEKPCNLKLLCIETRLSSKADYRWRVACQRYNLNVVPSLVLESSFYHDATNVLILALSIVADRHEKTLSSTNHVM